MTLSISNLTSESQRTGGDRGRVKDPLAKAQELTELALSVLGEMKQAGEVEKLSEAATLSKTILLPDTDRPMDSHIHLFMRRAGYELGTKVPEYVNDLPNGPVFPSRWESDPSKWEDRDESCFRKLAEQMQRDPFENVLSLVRDQIEREITDKITSRGLPEIVHALCEQLKEVVPQAGGARLENLLNPYVADSFCWDSQALSTLMPVLNEIQVSLIRTALVEPSKNPFTMGLPNYNSVVLSQIGEEQDDGSIKPGGMESLAGWYSQSDISMEPEGMEASQGWYDQVDIWHGDDLVLPEPPPIQPEIPSAEDELAQSASANETKSEEVGKDESDEPATGGVRREEAQEVLEVGPVEEVNNWDKVAREWDKVARELKTLNIQQIVIPQIVIDHVEWFLKRERLPQSPSVFLGRLGEFCYPKDDSKEDNRFFPNLEDIKNLDPRFWYEMAYVDDVKWAKRLEVTRAELRTRAEGGDGQQIAVEAKKDGADRIDELLQTREGRVKLALEALYPDLRNDQQSDASLENIAKVICRTDGLNYKKVEVIQSQDLDKEGKTLKGVMEFLSNNSLVEFLSGSRRVRLVENLPYLLQAALHKHTKPDTFRKMLEKEKRSRLTPESSKRHYVLAGR